MAITQNTPKTKILTFAAAALLFGLGASAVSHNVSASPANPTIAEASIAETPRVSENVAAQGTFQGRSDHVTSGEAYIMKTNTGYALVLSDSFFLDGAPTPVLGFGKNGDYVKASQFSKLEATKGRQTYKLPANFTPSDFNEIYVWCERFDIPLGVATLS